MSRFATVRVNAGEVLFLRGAAERVEVTNATSLWDESPILSLHSRKHHLLTGMPLQADTVSSIVRCLRAGVFVLALTLVCGGCRPAETQQVAPALQVTIDDPLAV
jgi:hypothetical protein